MKKYIINILSVFFSISVWGQGNELPFIVTQLFDLNNSNTLGLEYAKEIETVTIFSPIETDNKYNHGVVLFPFKGRIYAQWQSSLADEDSEETQVFYSSSPDGIIWDKPAALTQKWDSGIKTSGGWWSDGSTLIAYICVWPDFNQGSKAGYTEYLASSDGLNWQEPKPIKNTNGQPVMGIIEQDVHALPCGRLITAFHMQPGLICTPFYTNDPLGISGWIAGNMKNLETMNINMSRELEPAWFYRQDSSVIMIFRDQENSFKKLAAISKDNGVNWSTPVIVDTPDSRAKQSAGNLPDGTAFMVNNPTGNKTRYPLVITLSDDGFLFNRAYLLRGGDDLQPMRFSGKYKRVGYSYPKSVVWGNFLYVAYATNKEDVELTRIPIESLKQSLKP